MVAQKLPGRAMTTLRYVRVRALSCIHSRNSAQLRRTNRKQSMTRSIPSRARWALLTAAVVLGTTADAQNAVGVLSCGLDFEVAVRHGPSAGLRLKGDLFFSFDRSGALRGDFTPTGGSRVPTVGQVQGRTMGLVFSFGGEEYVWGTGSAAQPIFGLDCGAVIGGTFAGPKDGDIGDWIAKAKPQTPSEN